MRSVKYSLLFIVLTFVLFFFAEYINNKRIHPIQYMLVGFALVIFYSMLFSLSEHISFNLSYLISSVAIVSLISIFFQAILKKKKATYSVMASLTILYSFLFGLLQLMEYSLILGNIGLFIILAIVMYF